MVYFHTRRQFKSEAFNVSRDINHVYEEVNYRKSYYFFHVYYIVQTNTRQIIFRLS